MNIVNLTPHPIRLFSEVADGPIMILPPDGRQARLAEEVSGHSLLWSIPVREVDYGVVEGLPDPEPSTYYVVPLLVALASRRTDLFVPYDQVRNEEGTVIGCRALGRVAQ